MIKNGKPYADHRSQLNETKRILPITTIIRGQLLAAKVDQELNVERTRAYRAIAMSIKRVGSG